MALYANSVETVRMKRKGNTTVISRWHLFQVRALPDGKKILEITALEGISGSDIRIAFVEKICFI